MTYRIVYAPPADDAHRKMPDATRRGFDSGMREVAQDPYAAGSQPLDGARDRREATVAGVVIRYFVAPTVVTVTVVRMVWV
ncbi:hypothetical protein [Streptomyces bohaiensis]|uniref:hypothetical protein n=1 Tax=Streptomyces bohaiensis TaxID=1431344 RepID=UPI003B81FB44